MEQETYIHPYVVIGLIILVLWITSRRPGPTINNNPQAHASAEAHGGKVNTNTTVKGGGGGAGVLATGIVALALLGLVGVVGLSAVAAISGGNAVASQVASQQATIQQQIAAQQPLTQTSDPLSILFPIVGLLVVLFILWRVGRGIIAGSRHALPTPSPYRVLPSPDRNDTIEGEYRVKQLPDGARNSVPLSLQSGRETEKVRRYDE